MTAPCPTLDVTPCDLPTQRGPGIGGGGVNDLRGLPAAVLLQLPVDMSTSASLSEHTWPTGAALPFCPLL